MKIHLLVYPARVQKDSCRHCEKYFRENQRVFSTGYRLKKYYCIPCAKLTHQLTDKEEKEFRKNILGRKKQNRTNGKKSWEIRRKEESEKGELTKNVNLLCGVEIG